MDEESILEKQSIESGLERMTEGQVPTMEMSTYVGEVPYDADLENVVASKFVKSLYSMMRLESNAPGIGWSSNGKSVEIRDSKVLSERILPKYFKHCKVSSLLRQFNNYDFRSLRKWRLAIPKVRD